MSIAAEMMYKNDPSKMYTLDDFISMQISDNMTYYNFSILEIIDGVEHLEFNLIDDYLPEIKKKCLQVQLDKKEMSKYRFHPDLLAFDLYGSVQLDFVILLLNDMVDPKEFINSTIYLPHASTLYNVLDSIYSKELPYLELN